MSTSKSASENTDDAVDDSDVHLDDEIRIEDDNSDKDESVGEGDAHGVESIEDLRAKIRAGDFDLDLTLFR